MDIQQLAKEFEQLKQYEYKLLLDNDEMVYFSFSDEDFYHLLGFGKFSDVTIVKMIESRKYTKKKFYKEILKGNINYNEVKIPIKNMDRFKIDGKIVNFCDAEINDKTKHVLKNRFPYFKYEVLLNLVSSETIILYDKSKSNKWNKVEADKLFFKLISEVDKNLYLFIRRSESLNRDCPVSFFLEAMRDSHIKLSKEFGNKRQNRAKILYRIINEKGNIKKINDFSIFWNNVRESNSECEEFVSQKRLQKYYNGKAVRSNVAYRDLKNMQVELADIEEKLTKLNCLRDRNNLINLYFEESQDEKKLEIAMDLIEIYDFDVIKLDFFEEDPSVMNEIKVLAERKGVLRDRIKKFSKFLPTLEILEIKDVRKIYSYFLQEINFYETEFIKYLIEDKCIFDKCITPSEIKLTYEKWKELKDDREFYEDDSYIS